ncbi:MAG: EpsG family protein [Clostridia bacterium]|nr:EpsG family protein [Clostridia bacterium]MDY5264183.1 EpsG family protein [Eubacteriales bacterium]
MYFVSLTPFNSLFIAIPAVIDMSIMSYIILKQMGNKSKMAMKDLLLIIISFLGLFSIKYMFSAVRSNLSVSLVSLAFYLDYIRGEKRPFAFILYFLAIFVHYYAVIMIAIRIFMIFVKNRSPYWFALVFALPFMYKFMTVIYPVGNNYIDELMALFIGYYYRFNIIGIIKNGDFTSLNSLMCFVLFAIIIFYIANERNYRFLGENGTTNNFAIAKDKEKLFLYISSILLWMLLPNWLLLERYIQFMGYGTLFYLTKNIKTISKKKKTLLLLVTLYVIIWDIFFLGINYTGYNPLAGIKDKLF